ncbi:MAG: response regulator transcription factor [Ignavibacteriaceae bacterium]
MNKINGVEGIIVSTKATPEKLREAIITVMSGGKYYCNYITEEILAEEEIEDKTEILTRREKEIFNLAQSGMQNKYIASKLCISVKTVENHKENHYRPTKIVI